MKVHSLRDFGKKQLQDSHSRWVAALLGPEQVLRAFGEVHRQMKAAAISRHLVEVAVAVVAVLQTQQLAHQEPL